MNAGKKNRLHRYKTSRDRKVVTRMSKATNKAKAIVEKQEAGHGAVVIELSKLIEKGQHLPSHKDINQAHKVFIGCLDENHPQAVEMLLAVEQLKQMTDQFRADRDALVPLLEATATLLGCAQMLSKESQKDAYAAIQTHFFNLLNLLSQLNITCNLPSLKIYLGKEVNS